MTPVFYQKTGTRHLGAGTPCQDFILYQENDDHRMIALADGVSACENSHLGARTACHTAVGYFLNYGETLTDCTPEKASALILNEVLFALQKTARQQGISPESLSSTLSFCCIDKVTGDATIFHLGDGAVFLLDDHRTTMLLRPSASGSPPPQTLLPTAYRYASIRNIPLPPGGRVMICSDGLLDLLSGEHAPRIIQLLSQQDFPQLTQFLESVEVPDDCSFIVF